MIPALVPLIRKDLLLVARRRRWFVARALTVAVLLLVTIPLFVNLAMTSATRSTAQAAPIVQGMFVFFVWSQFVLVLLAAPAFGAGTLGDARNRVAVELLRLASISRPSLAAAKLAGATAFPLLLSAASVPFLALWSLWGGVSLGRLLAIFALTAATAVAFVGFGLLAGAVARSSGAAIVGAYGLATLWCLAPPLASSMIPSITRVRFHAPTALHEVLSQGPASDQWPWAVAASAGLAVLATLATGLTMFVGDFVRRSTRRASNRKSRRVWGMPVLWRELRLGLHSREARFVLACWILAAALVAFHGLAPAPKDVREVALLIAYGPVPGLVFAVLGAMSVTGEKEAGTVQSLLLAPGGSLGVVTGKFTGVLFRGLPVFIPPLFHALRAPDAKWIFGLLSVALVSIYIGAFATLCSVVFKRTTTAVIGTLGGLVLQVVCSCNMITALVMALPAALMDIGKKGLPDLQGGMILLLASSAYLLAVGINLAIAIAVFEPATRRSLR